MANLKETKAPKSVKQSGSSKFNINSIKIDDLRSIKAKDKIRKKLERILDGAQTFASIDDCTAKDINTSIAAMNSNDRLLYNQLFKVYSGRGLGPGEFILYLLIDDLTLTPSNSTYDASSGRSKVEIKAGRYHQANRAIYDFKPGGSSNLVKTYNAVADDLYNLAKSENINTKELPTAQISALKKKAPALYEDARRVYAEAVATYFKEKTIVIFGRDGKDQGKCLLIGSNIRPNDIDIYAVTRGFVKPLIKYSL